MRMDHVSYACDPDGLTATTERIAAALGVKAVRGGIHPRFGTRNMIIPLTARHYIEVVEVLDHPASDKAPFGQAVRARSNAGGGWMGWCVEVEDLSPFEARLGRSAVPGNRKFPDGRELVWQQIGIKGLIADPQVPYLLKWEGEPARRRSGRAQGQPDHRRFRGAGDRMARRMRGQAARGRGRGMDCTARHARHHERHFRHGPGPGHGLNPADRPGSQPKPSCRLKVKAAMSSRLCAMTKGITRLVLV